MFAYLNADHNSETKCEGNEQMRMWLVRHADDGSHASKEDKHAGSHELC
jgi:hypothetical protein